MRSIYSDAYLTDPVKGMKVGIYSPIMSSERPIAEGEIVRVHEEGGFEVSGPRIEGIPEGTFWFNKFDEIGGNLLSCKPLAEATYEILDGGE